MAKAEHLALLRQGAAIWNEWRARSPHRQPDLSDANLREDVSGAHPKEDFSGANLSAAYLLRANLYGANLREANLSGAILTNATLNYADLTGANLANASLIATDLGDANLQGANLREADLHATNLSQANLRTADLRKAVFSRTILGNVDLTHTLGLDRCEHFGPSVIDFQTLSRSENLSINFLRGCGLPDTLIEYLPSLRGDAVQFYSCFISYSARDQVFAERLHADLQNKGVRCWFAPHDLPIGAKTWDAIDEAIRLRDKLLPILSKASIESEWVEDEVNKAYAEERSRKQVVLFPIRIDDAVMTTPEPWARKLRDQRHIGDFRLWEKPVEYQKSLERLLRDLRAGTTK